jgi:hypothetical protein
MSDFPCKFFVLNVGVNTTVRMIRFKHINTYLRDIEPISMDTVYKSKNPIFYIKHDVFEYDDEKQEIDWDLTEGFPRMVKWDAKLI